MIQSAPRPGLWAGTSKSLIDRCSLSEVSARQQPGLLLHILCISKEPEPHSCTRGRTLSSNARWTDSGRLHISTTTRGQVHEVQCTWGMMKPGLSACYSSTFHSDCPTLLATTLPNTRSSTFGMFRGVRGRLKSGALERMERDEETASEKSCSRVTHQQYCNLKNSNGNHKGKAPTIGWELRDFSCLVFKPLSLPNNSKVSLNDMCINFAIKPGSNMHKYA